MKKVLKSCTFWFGIASLLIILLNVTGQDSKNALLFLSNWPVFWSLNRPGVSYLMPVHAIYFWYALHFVTYLIYGGAIDLIRYLIKRNK